MPPTPTISRLLLLPPPHDSSSTPSPPRPPPRPPINILSPSPPRPPPHLRPVSSRLRLHLHLDRHNLLHQLLASIPLPRRTARVHPRTKRSTEHFPTTRPSWNSPGVLYFTSFPRGVLPQGSMWNSATTRTGGRILFGHRAVWWPTPTWKAANSASLGPPKRSFRCEEPTQVVQPAAVAQPAEIANHHGGRGIVEPVNGTRRLRQEQPALVRGRCRRCGLR